MAKLPDLSDRVFLIGTAVIVGVLFSVNIRRYAMPDALAETAGYASGAYIFAWIVWRILKMRLGDRAPRRRFLLALAAVSVAPQLSDLFVNHECIKGPTKTDVCRLARQISDPIAEKLPMKLSQNMSLESAGAFGTEVQMHIRLSYDRGYLEQMYRDADLPLSDAKQAMHKSEVSTWCQENTPYRAFIELGGSVRTIYSFGDGERFAAFVVNSCH